MFAGGRRADLLELAGVASTAASDGTSLFAAAMGAPAGAHGALDGAHRATPSRAASNGCGAGHPSATRTSAWIGALDLPSMAWVEEVWFDRRDGVEAPRTTPPTPTPAFRDEVARARLALETPYRARAAGR